MAYADRRRLHIHRRYRRPLEGALLKVRPAHSHAPAGASASLSSPRTETSTPVHAGAPGLEHVSVANESHAWLDRIYPLHQIKTTAHGYTP